MENSITQIASLIGEPVRARILWTLMDGKAYTARELAIGVETTPQNLSMHLSKLLRAGLLAVESQGRHRYYSFSREEVAYAVEAMANLIPAGQVARKEPEEVPIRYCRSCYDHLAGKLAVSITESMLRQKLIAHRDQAWEVTQKGNQWFAEWGIDCGALRTQRRAFAKPCLDWSERRHHLSGALGSALLSKMLESNWLRRTAGSRVLIVTGKGRQAIETRFHIQCQHQ